MSYIIVGLGNPGEIYEDTRHNLGRMVVLSVAESGAFSDWRFDKKRQAQICQGKVGSEKIELVLPETFMNLSGKSLAGLVKNLKQAEKLIVAHDDLDLPLGAIKISFDKSSGGHKGIESIIKTIKTQAFVRVRIGISAVTKTGKLKKPKGEEAVKNFVLGKFKSSDKKQVKQLVGCGRLAVLTIVDRGRSSAMNEFN